MIPIAKRVDNSEGGICIAEINSSPSLTEQEMSGKINYTVHNGTEDDMYGKIRVALYDSKGKLVRVTEHEEYTSVLSGKTEVIPVVIEWKELSEQTYTLKVFYWDEMMPLVDACEVKY